VRKRFTVAHEVGHFVLHRNQIGESLTDDELYRSGLSTRQEAQANRFAADILMPKDLILKTINRLGDDPQVLASEFKVSEAAMRIRLDAVWPTPYTRVAV
jgi:Zn-dependent peptidase ImmA (M78 family)